MTKLREWTTLLKTEARTKPISAQLLYWSTPDLSDEKARYALHERLLQKIHSTVTQRHLQAVGPVEQLLADVDGPHLSEADARIAVDAVVRDAEIHDAFRVAALFAMRFPESSYPEKLSATFTPGMRLWVQRYVRRNTLPNPNPSSTTWLARMLGMEPDSSVAIFYRHQPLLARILDAVRSASLDSRAYPSARPGRAPATPPYGHSPPLTLPALPAQLTHLNPDRLGLSSSWWAARRWLRRV